MSSSIHIYFFINIISGYPIFAYHQNMSPYNPVGHFTGTTFTGVGLAPTGTLRLFFTAHMGHYTTTSK
jgi:hypothetical protein